MNRKCVQLVGQKILSSNKKAAFSISAARTASMMRKRIMILNMQENDQRSEKKASIPPTNVAGVKEHDDLLDCFTTSAFL